MTRSTSLLSKLCKLCATLSLVLACDREPDEGSTSEHAATASAPPSSPTASSSSKPAQAPGALEQSDVRSFISNWIKAQNEGDFENYASLYADKFLGVKRAGDRTSKFERAGWLEDRKKMFASPMKVDAKDIEIRSASQSAVVRFVQQWSSKSFEDIGPKQLVLVGQDGQLKIAREEMLKSEIRKDNGKATTTGFIFVFEQMAAITHGGKTGLGIERFDGDASFNLRRESKVGAKLPDKITTYSVEGKACTAQPTTPWRVAQVIPHFSQVQFWNGEIEGHPPLPIKEKEQAVWEMANPVEAVGLKGCDDALWALSPGAPIPTVFALGEATEQEQRDAEKMLQTTDAYKRVQERFSELGGKGRWAAVPQLRVFKHENSRLIAASATAAQAVGDECGGYQGHMIAIFASTPSGLQHVASAIDGEREIRAIFDLGSDGELELLTDGAVGQELWRINDGKLQLLAEFSPIGNFDCAC